MPQSQYTAQDCPADATERVQAADWARVRTITVRIRQDEFEPMVSSITQDRAYVLRLENGDRAAHAFRSPEFFKAIAIESATVGGRELAEACPSHVVLEAGETAEFRFVAVRDGHYNFKDAPLPISFGGGAIGVIVIDAKQTFTVGALNPKNIEETLPPAPAQPPPAAEPAPSDNPFDTYQPPADETGKAAQGAAPNPFDTVMPVPEDAAKAAPEAEPNPFDAVEPAPAEDAEPNPFDAVEPAPAEDAAKAAPEAEPNPFDVVEPAPAEDAAKAAPDLEPNPFETVEPAPAEADAPGPMVQALPPGEPAPPPVSEDGTDPFGALEPERSLPLE